MFQPVNSRVNFPQLEERIIELWRKNNTFIRSVEARQGGPRFVLYEGPPTANASPGIHFVMPPVFKDIIPRYKAMKGYYAPRIGGWDTHGLPVELEVVQCPLPGERLPLHQRVRSPDGAHRLLDRYGKRLCHFQERVHRDLLVDNQADMGQRPSLPGLSGNAPLSAMRYLIEFPRGRTGLQRGHRGPLRLH
jgi:hypothetical protein